MAFSPTAFSVTRNLPRAEPVAREIGLLTLERAEFKWRADGSRRSGQSRICDQALNIRLNRVIDILTESARRGTCRLAVGQQHIIVEDQRAVEHQLPSATG